MLTPKDISAIKFDKVIVGGYDMGAVDDFLDQVEKDYTALVNENNLLKSKMRQLVKKIEEYRSMDDSMRKALSSAQTMAAQIVDKARQEAGTIRAGAQKNGDEILADYQTRIAAEQKKLAMAKASVEDFVSRMTTSFSPRWSCQQRRSTFLISPCVLSRSVICTRLPASAAPTGLR